jgi:hypothetical protein
MAAVFTGVKALTFANSYCYVPKTVVKKTTHGEFQKDLKSHVPGDACTGIDKTVAGNRPPLSSTTGKG